MDWVVDDADEAKRSSLYSTKFLFEMKQEAFEVGHIAQSPDYIFDTLSRSLISCPKLVQCSFSNETNRGHGPLPGRIF